MKITVDDKLAKQNLFAVMQGIGKATITNAHIALHQAAKKINDDAVGESSGNSRFAHTKLTAERYKRGKVKTKQYKNGRKFQAGSYSLNVSRDKLRERKIPHKKGNKWIRVALNTEIATSESDPLYWSFLKGFFSNSKITNRQQKSTGKNLGKLRRHDFFRIAAIKNKKTIKELIKLNMRKIKATKTGA